MRIPARLTKKRLVLQCLAIALACCSANAGDLLVSSRFSDNVLRYDGETGAFKGVFASGNGMDNPNGIAFGPDRNLYVGLGDVGRVMIFDGESGLFLRDFVTPATAGGLAGCRAIAFLADGDLLVNSGATNQVLRYAPSGQFKGVFGADTELLGPVGLAVGADGSVFVGAALGNIVAVFDRDGTRLRSLPAAAGHSNVTGVIPNERGQLFVAHSQSHTVRRLDPLTGQGSTFAAGGGLNIPIGMIIHPDGDLLVGSFGNDKVVRYNGTSGALVGDFISSRSGGLDGTHNLAFMPESLSISNGMTGAWFDPAQSGHGLFVEVLPAQRMLAWWFTFDAQGNQAWFGGVGGYTGNRATIIATRTQGGRFIPNFDPANITNPQWGTLTLTFDSCQSGRVEFASDLGFGSGSMPLTRLTLPAGLTCP